MSSRHIILREFDPIGAAAKERRTFKARKHRHIFASMPYCEDRLLSDDCVELDLEHRMIPGDNPVDVDLTAPRGQIERLSSMELHAWEPSQKCLSG